MGDTAEQKYAELLPMLSGATGLEPDFEVMDGAAPFVQLHAAPKELRTVWRWLWEQRGNAALWPVVLGEEALWMIEEAGRQPAEIVGLAASLDPVELLQRFERDVPTTEVGASPGRDAMTYEGLDVTAGLNEPSIGLFLADSGWQVQAQMQLEDGGRFSAVEHVAIMRYFEMTYGAGLVATNSASAVFVLPEPLTDPERAGQAARQRLAYADTTAGGGWEYEPEDVAAATMVDTVWSFWWD